MQIKRGRTSQSIPIRILDTTSVVGGGKTGLVYNSTNLAAYYKRELDASATAITLATMTAGTWATGGFVEEDATHLAGQYELGVPNAALGSGDASTWVEIMIYDSGSGLGIAPSTLRLDLVAYDPQDAMRLGLTALPNANAEAAGGLYTRGSGAGQIIQPSAGLIDANVTQINAVATTSVTTVNANMGTTQPENFTGTGASALVKTDAIDWASGAIPAPNVTGVPLIDIKYLLGTIFTEGAVGRLVAGIKQFFNITSPTSTMNEITLVDTTTALTNAPGAGDFTAAMKTSLNVATPSVTVSDKTGFSLSAAGVQAIWDALTSALTTVGSIGRLLVTNIDALISSRLASISYTAPDNTTISEIATDTDSILTNQTTINANVLTRMPTANLISDAGTAQGGSLTTIQLRAAAPAVTLVGQTVFITSGVGAGQSAPITAYDTITKIATTAWGTAPTAASGYVVIAAQGGGGGATPAEMWAFLGASGLSEDETLANVYLKLQSNPITVISPVNLAQTVVGPLIPGNDNLLSLGTQLPFTSPYAGVDATGGTLVYKGLKRDGTVLSKSGHLTDGQHGYVELTAAESEQLMPGIQQNGFSAEVTLPTTGFVQTWAWGTQIVQPVRGL